MTRKCREMVKKDEGSWLGKKGSSLAKKEVKEGCGE